MEETSDDSMKVLRFIRRNVVRIVIGAVLVMAVYGALLVWVPYQREQRIAKEIQAYGGEVGFQYCGPTWIPKFMRDRTTLFSRATYLSLDDTQVTDAGLEHLKGLTSLRSLFLGDTYVTDAGLEHLKGLTNISLLRLNNTRVTDAGLEHLKGLTNLASLYLAHTQVTDAGLERLKGLTKLTILDLCNTQFTDAGLEHLNGLTNLNVLALNETRSTAEGRAMLRKSLPNCEIKPDP